MQKKLFFLTVFLFISFDICAEYKFQPAIGMWFGPTAPILETANSINGHLGGGLLTRGNLPLDNFYYNLDFSWLHFSSNVEKRLDLYPIIGSFFYVLPFELPVKILIKLGGGSTYVKIQPENKSGWDPTFHFGSEFYFPAGKIVRIGLRADFLWIIERHIPGAERDGYVINFGLTVYFNIGT